MNTSDPCWRLLCFPWCLRVDGETLSMGNGGARRPNFIYTTTHAVASAFGMILLPPLVVMSEPRPQKKGQALVSPVTPRLCRTRFRFCRPEVTFNFVGSGCLVGSPTKSLCMVLVLEFAMMLSHLLVDGTTTLGRVLVSQSEKSTLILQPGPSDQFCDSKPALSL